MKKLSIVINSRNKQIQTQQLLKSIFKEKKVNLEVLLMDYSIDKTIDVVYNQFRKQIKNNQLKLYSFYKPTPSVIKEKAIKESIGDYILFIHAQDRFSKGFLDKIINIATAIESEIIEFRARYVGKIRTQSNAGYQLEPNNQYNVQNNPFILGLTSPFFYTKIFKRSFLLKNIDIFKLESFFDSYYSYILVSFAKSYYYIKAEGTIVKIQPSLKEDETLTKQWEMILNYFKSYTNWNITKKHLEYAYTSYLVKTLTPYINGLLVDSADKIRREKLLIRQLVKKFPDYKSNSLVRQDPTIQRSNFIKGQIKTTKHAKKVKYNWGKKTSVILDDEYDEKK